MTNIGPSSSQICFSPAVREKFEAVGKLELIDSLEGFYSQLLKCRREFVEYSNPETMSEVARAAANVQVLQQIHLHRAERLLVSAGSMIAEENIYGLTLLIRGHIESTAIMGYLCDRICAFMNGSVPFERVIFDIAHALMGVKHVMFKEKPDPVNIMTAIEKADRYFERKAGSSGQGMLADCYAWLSDFAHPNFLSGSSALKLNRSLGRLEFRHGFGLSEEEIGHLGYLDISAALFIMFFNDLTEMVPSAFPAGVSPDI